MEALGSRPEALRRGSRKRGKSGKSGKSGYFFLNSLIFTRVSLIFDMKINNFLVKINDFQRILTKKWLWDVRHYCNLQWNLNVYNHFL